MMHRVLIAAHSEEPAAIAATEQTLAMLSPGSAFARIEGGGLLRIAGYLVLETTQPDFVAWAAVRQGYVKAAVPPLNGPSEP